MSKQTTLQKISAWISDNIVTVVFLTFTIVGFIVSKDLSLVFFLTQLSERIFRNAFLILSLIIPVIAGLGMNFGIVVGAMAAQIALFAVRYFEMGNIPGLLLMVLIATPIAILFGFLTGILYNNTKGQEMIAGLILSYFANGVYQLIMLVIIGAVIPVNPTHPLINPSGIGVRMTIDLVALNKGGLRGVIDAIYQIPFMQAVLLFSIGILAFVVIRFVMSRKKPDAEKQNPVTLGIIGGICVLFAGISIAALSVGKPGPDVNPETYTMLQSLMTVKDAPVANIVLILLLCLFTNFFLKTKLGQDFRSVGQSQHIAEIAGVNVNRTRIIAVIFSTVLASWGHIIYLQNMGTVSTYGAHSQIGLFSVAALLIGGATTSKATVKNAILGCTIFHAMFIVSPEIGKAVFGNALLGEYFRTFMAYGVIGLSLGLFAWNTAKKARPKIE